jgi:peptidoglycan/LPS O-acetylase OafA/YrhL
VPNDCRTKNRPTDCLGSSVFRCMSQADFEVFPGKTDGGMTIPSAKLQCFTPRNGRTIVLVFIILILLVSVGVIGLYVSAFGTTRLPAQIVRFLLTAALCFWLYQGSMAAKWIMVILLGLGGLLALANVSSDNPVAFAFGAGLATVYLSFAVVMVASSSVNAFLAHQRSPASSKFDPSMDREMLEDREED